MGKNNICVIYDSDESYAKRLMSVINDDNDIPYNAQVFTKENDLDRYLKEKKADVLMIVKRHMSMIRTGWEVKLLYCVKKMKMQMKLIPEKERI